MANLYAITFCLPCSKDVYKRQGTYTSVTPILNGDMYSGVTLHEIDKGIDTGDIIAQIKFEIGINDTARDLYFKYNQYGFQLFKENIDSLIKNSFISRQQSKLGSTCLLYTSRCV